MSSVGTHIHTRAIRAVHVLAIHYETADITGGKLIFQAITARKDHRYRLQNQYQYQFQGEQFFYHSVLKDYEGGRKLRESTTIQLHWREKSAAKVDLCEPMGKTGDRFTAVPHIFRNGDDNVF